MRRKTAVRLVATGAMALLLSGATGNWTGTVAATDGGHRIGNPDAKIKVQEFVSYTCPHCGDFAKQGDGELLISYVAPGKVNVEVRHIIRDPVDMTVALLTNCGPAAKFPRNHAAFMHSQDKWIGLMSKASSAQRQRWSNGTKAARFRAIAADFGFYRIMEQRGYSRAAADRCLGDDALATKLAKDSTSDWDKYGLGGTPAFTINGITLAGTHSWDMLKPQLDARM